MEITFLGLKLGTKSAKKTIAQQNHDFWMNELQCLFLASRNEVVCVRGKDIESVWTENNGQSYWKKFPDGHVESNPDYKPSYWIRTKSGKDFQLSHESWCKCRFEDPNYKLGPEEL